MKGIMRYILSEVLDILAPWMAAGCEFLLWLASLVVRFTVWFSSKYNKYLQENS